MTKQKEEQAGPETTHMEARSLICPVEYMKRESISAKNILAKFQNNSLQFTSWMLKGQRLFLYTDKQNS